MLHYYPLHCAQSANENTAISCPQALYVQHKLGSNQWLPQNTKKKTEVLSRMQHFLRVY